MTRRAVACALFPMLILLGGCPDPEEPGGGTATPTSGLSEDPTETVAPTVTAPATPTQAATATVAPTPSEAASPTAPPFASPTQPQGETPTEGQDATLTDPPTPSPTEGSDATPTDILTPSPTEGPDATSTDLLTPSPTEGPDATLTNPPSETPTVAPTPTVVPTPTAPTDSDGDGHPVATDCDDGDASIYPGAPESCDSADQDCDGQVDEDVTNQWYLDADRDQYGSGEAVEGCQPPTSVYTDRAGDCDDSDPQKNPDADERCNLEDDDCDASVDEDPVDAPPYFTDDDGDGFGAQEAGLACVAPDGASAVGGDCDDSNSGIYPGADEHCDEVDEDCDTDIDEDVVDAPVWHLDADGDDYGRDAESIQACGPPSASYVSAAGDCDDLDPAEHPGADELCDEEDDDCDGDVDEEPADPPSWYLDADDDGFGRDAGAIAACEPPSASYAAEGGDCADLNAAIHPGAAEVCNEGDDDCDTAVDEGVLSTFFVDGDGDGFGAESQSSQGCEPPDGTSEIAGDCDDDADQTYPGADEICDGEDNGCDGDVPADEIDQDGDSQPVCAGDCDDDDPERALGLPEICDGKDNDCNGDLPDDEADLDEDGYLACVDDCDDSNAAVSPGEPEVCDGLDNDCNTVIDDVDGESCDHFNGDFGDSWEGPLAAISGFSGNLSTYHPLEMPYIYNFYTSISNSAARYDLEAGTWSATASEIPISEAWTTAAPWDGAMWMARDAKIYRFDIDTEVWTTEATLKADDDYNMTETDEYGYVYGYLNTGEMVIYDTDTGDIDYYNTGLGSEYETRMGYDPATRSIFFGAFNAGNIYRFDIDARSVEFVTSHPESFLNDIYCSDRAGHLYAAGGSSGQTLWQYDIADDSWQRLPDFPVDHGNNGSCTVSETGHLYMSTGGTAFYRLELY